MPNSPRSSNVSEPQISPGLADRGGRPQLPIHLPRLPGRLRHWRHWLLLPPLIGAGWVWFGLIGLVPLLVWWWWVRPRRCSAPWQVDLDGLRAARLGPLRTLLLYRPRPPCSRRIWLLCSRRMEIFSDELTPDDLARLRREVKLLLSAGNRPQHVETV